MKRRLYAVIAVVTLSVSCCTVMSAPRADAARNPKPCPGDGTVLAGGDYHPSCRQAKS